MSGALEARARFGWEVWGVRFALWTHCAVCAQWRYCRGRRRRRMLCLDCWDGGAR